MFHNRGKCTGRYAATRDRLVQRERDCFAAAEWMEDDQDRYAVLETVGTMRETRVAFEEILSLWPHFRVDESDLARLPSLWVRAWQHVHVELDSQPAAAT